MNFIIIFNFMILFYMTKYSSESSIQQINNWNFNVRWQQNASSPALYLIKLLQHKGMPQRQLSVVTYSIVVSYILYALPAWGGFLNAELISRINAFFRRVKWFSWYCTYSWWTVKSVRVWFLCEDQYTRPLSTSLPPPPYRSSNLRERGHSFPLVWLWHCLV